MDFTHTDDRRMLADTLAKYLRDRYTPAVREAHAYTGDGFSRDVWQEMCDLGIMGALIPEEQGGFGGAGHDIAVVFEALGRALVVEPFLSTGILGARLAGACGRADLVEAAVSGSLHLALAHYEPQSRYDLAAVETTAKKDGEGYVLDGRKCVVLGAGFADRLIVSARLEGDRFDIQGLALFEIDPKAEGVTVHAYPLIDGAAAGDVFLDQVRVGADALMGPAGDAYPLIEEVIGLGALALSAEAVGAMETAKDTTIDYLKQRKQFGRAISSFQALQHRAVDMVIEIEQARSALIRAASMGDAPQAARQRAISAAKNLAGRVGTKIAEEAIQLHGGIGMTWEYPLSHYAKRLIMIDHQLGDTDYHLERFVALGAA
jgi:alkylation response protein AidB-like acyl-CoA dehydrogenase